MKLKMTTLFCATLIALASGCSCRQPEETTPAPLEEEPAMIEEATEDEHVHIEGNHLTLDDHIRFETGSDTIAAESYELLDEVARLMGAHEEITALRLEGHTDQHGGAEHNMELSQRRAASVATYLREHGVAQPIESAGFGETRPICEEESQECDEQNRRVEFIITVQGEI